MASIASLTVNVIVKVNGASLSRWKLRVLDAVALILGISLEVEVCSAQIKGSLPQSCE